MILRSFLKDRREFQQAQKRGGGKPILPLDRIAIQELLPDRKSTDPEMEFDRLRAIEVAKRSMESVRERLRSEGREIQFRVYEEYDLKAGPAKPTYASLAGRLGLTETQVRNFLFAVREEVKSAIRLDLARTLSDEADVDDEWRELYG